MIEAFIKAAEKSGASFQLGDVVAPAVSAMRSPDVARDVMSLGAITLKASAPGFLEETEASDGTKLMVVLFDYAMEVAPRVEGDQNVIDVAALSNHANYMRNTFGDVEVSSALIARMGQVAQIQINMNKLAGHEAPENREH